MKPIPSWLAYSIGGVACFSLAFLFEVWRGKTVGYSVSTALIVAIFVGIVSPMLDKFVAKRKKGN